MIAALGQSMSLRQLANLARKLIASGNVRR
jgi:hypothetical protein